MAPMGFGNPFVIAAVVTVVAVLAVIWRVLKSRTEGPSGFVLLLKQPAAVSAGQLAQILSEESGSEVAALEGPADPGEERPAGDFVTGTSPHFIAFVAGGMYAFHSFAGRYGDNPERIAKYYPDLRLRKAILENRAWLAMDIHEPKVPAPGSYRFAARVIARLVNENAMAIFYPPQRLLAVVDETTVERLQAEDPIQTLFFSPSAKPPVLGVESDPRLDEAIAEARRRFPEFQAAFQRGSGDKFAVKAKLTAGSVSEHIWILVNRIEGDTIGGRLGNEPVDLDGLHLDSTVEVNAAEISDWVYGSGDKPVGLFTPKVIQQLMEEQQRKR